MSPSTSGGPCGDPHDKDCSEIQHHLDECGPCLQKYDLERTVKALIQRSCAEHAPETLRDKVLLRIRQVQVEITDG